jgi:hypothetical protein
MKFRCNYFKNLTIPYSLSEKIEFVDYEYETEDKKEITILEGMKDLIFQIPEEKVVIKKPVIKKEK